MLRRLVRSVLVVLVALVGISPASATVVEDEQIASPHSADPGLHGVEFNEVSGLRDNVSVLHTDGTPRRICTAVDASPCATSDFTFRAVLAPCDATVAVDCIESVSATVAGQTSSGTFTGTFPLHGVTDFTGSDALGVPSGGAPGTWSFSSVPHAFGSDYQVTVMVTGRKVSGSALSRPRSFFANITPVSIFQTSCDPQYDGHCMDTYYEDPDTGTVRFAGVAADQGGGFRCQNWGENGKCALKHAFPAGVRFALKVRLRAVPSGWLHGRLTDPSASIVTADGVTTVTVEAAPTRVPVVAASAQYSSLPASVRQWFDTNCSESCGTRRRDNNWSDPLVRNAVSLPAAYKDSSFSQLDLWRDYTGDKAYAMPSVWNVRTLSDSEMSSAPACIRTGTGVTGIVSSNATLYAEGPPSFDRSTSSLLYKVSAPHWERDGSTPFLGRYSLLLRSDIAECLYGAPDFSVGSSTVTVTGADGVARSAVTSVSATDGWYSFNASGFTHSAPILRARLSPRWPTVRKGARTKVTTLAKRYGMTVPSKATVKATVAPSSRSVCSVTARLMVSAKKAGTCRITVAVTPPKTKKVRHPVTIRKTVTLKVTK